MKNTFVAFDLETTGFEAGKDEIIEIGLAKFENGKVTEKLDVLVKPSKPVPKAVLAVTGINEEELRVAKDFENYRESVIKFIDKNIIIGHNVDFDLRFLSAVGIEFPENLVFDTWHLSQIFYPFTSSLSLEILAEKLGILPETSHRAYLDAQTSGFLFLNLLKLNEQLDAGLKNEFEKILKNSTSPILEFFKLPKKFCGDFELKKIKEEEECFSTSKESKANLAEALNSGSNLLIEASTTLRDVLDVSPQKSTIIAIPTSAISEFFAISKFLKKDFNFLFNANEYLSPSFFNKFKNQKLDDAKTRFALKLENARFRKNVLLRSEISIMWDERGMWEQVSGEKSEFNEKLKRANNQDCVVVDLATLLENNFSQDRLILWEADELEDNISENFGWHFNSKNTEFLVEEIQNYYEQVSLDQADYLNLSESFEFFWGLLGIFCRNYVQEKSPYTMYAPIDNYTRTRQDFDRITASVLKILDLLEKVKKRVKENDSESLLIEKLSTIQLNLQTIFSDPKPGGIYWAYIRGEEPIVGVEGKPIKMDSIVGSKIISKFKYNIFVANSLVTDESFEFVKNRLGIADFNEEVLIEKTKANIKVLSGFATKQPNYSEDVFDYILNENEARKGNLVVLFSNGGDLQRVYEKLLSSELNTPVVAQLAGMSIKKIRQAMLNQTGIFLLLNSVISKRFYIKDIEKLVLTKIPFEVFSHPLIKKRQEGYLNGFNDYLLRRSIIKINKIIDTFSQHEHGLSVVITDPALTTKNYGQDIVENLSKHNIELGGN